MQRALRAARAIDAVHARVGTWAAWATLVMVLVSAFNAVARYLERDLGVEISSNAYVELQWYLFGLIFLFGAPYALRRDRHVRVDVLYGRHSARAKAWIDLVGTLVLLLPFAVAMIVYSVDFVRESWRLRETSPDAGGLARYPLKAAIPLAFTLLALQGVAQVIHCAATLCGDSAGGEERA